MRGSASQDFHAFSGSSPRREQATLFEFIFPLFSSTYIFIMYLNNILIYIQNEDHVLL